MVELDLVHRYPFKSKEKVLVDVGAHIGSFSCAFVLGGWHVICFEPERDNFADLINNFGDFDNAIFYQMAAGEKHERLPFYVSSKHFGIHSLAKWHPTHELAYEVDVVPLREIVPNNVTLLKIDVEGAELPVLKGFDFDAQQPEMIFLEFEDARTREFFGYDHHDIVNYLKPYGYHVKVSEWTDGNFSTKTVAGTRKPIGIFDYPLDHQPIWGNLIFTKESYEG